MPAESDTETITGSDLWTLGADPAGIQAAADSWHRMATGLREAHGVTAEKSRSLSEDDWSGDAADSYHSHLDKLGRSVSETADAMAAAGDQLADLAWTLRETQNNLDDHWARLAAMLPAARTGGEATFWPQTDGDPGVIAQARQDATAVNTAIETYVNDKTATFDRLGRMVTAAAAQWRQLADDGRADWSVPPEISGIQAVEVGDQVIVVVGKQRTMDGPSDDADITITRFGDDIVVTDADGGRVSFSDKHVTIAAGAGDDSISVQQGLDEPAVPGITVLGGTGDDDISTSDGDDLVLGMAGNDRIATAGGRDRVSGGGGHDNVDGGRGDDLLSGGGGNDVVYGMAGKDRVDGDDGDDYLEGATGDDTLTGGSGHDILSGGRDDDALDGGAGPDTVYTGLGTDRVDTAEVVYAQPDDTVRGADTRVDVVPATAGPGITLTDTEPPDSDYAQRVAADLDMLGSSPAGQQMLAAVDPPTSPLRVDVPGQPVYPGGIGTHGHHLDGSGTVTIRPMMSGDGPFTHEGGAASAGPPDDTPEVPSAYPYSDVHVQYDPSFSTAHTPPPVVLHHELAHAYDYHHDSQTPGVHSGADDDGVNNLEREAVGLPVDDDQNPATPERLDPDHPSVLTENAIRTELGLPLRDRYSDIP